jgi:hypothetical protein
MTLLYLRGFLPETPRAVAFWPPLFRFSQTDQPCNSGCFARFVQCLEHCNLPHHGKGTSSRYQVHVIPDSLVPTFSSIDQRLFCLLMTVHDRDKKGDICCLLPWSLHGMPDARTTASTLPAGRFRRFVLAQFRLCTVRANPWPIRGRALCLSLNR